MDPLAIILGGADLPPTIEPDPPPVQSPYGTVVTNIHKQGMYDVYIGRAGQGFDGPFGNPPLGKYKICPYCGTDHQFKTKLDCYPAYLDHRVSTDPEFREAVKGLSGKRLGCFCKPKRCHGDYLAQVADRLRAEDEGK